MERICTSEFSDQFYIESYKQCGFAAANLRVHAGSYQCDVDYNGIYKLTTHCNVLRACGTIWLRSHTK